MSTGGFDYTSPAFSGIAAAPMDRFAALMAGGFKPGKLDLLLHLVANLPRSILLLGTHGTGKTTLLRQVQARALGTWVVCYLAATANLNLERVCAELLHVLQQSAPAGGSSPERELEEQLTQLSRQERKLILLLDDAGLLMPGLLGALCQFARLHPQFQLTFALRPEDLAQKAASDALALADAHILELEPADGRGMALTQAQPLPPAQSGLRATGLAKAFRFILRHREGPGPRPIGWIALSALAAATAAGVVVGALWRNAPPPPSAAIQPAATPLLPPGVSTDSPPEHPEATAIPQATGAPAPTPEGDAMAEIATPPQHAAETSPTSLAPPSPAAETSPPPPVIAEPAPTAPAAPEKPFAEVIATAASTRAAAFARLFDLWDITTPLPPGDACSYAKQIQLRCHPLRTDWHELQTLDRPALLELVLPGGARRYATLTALEGDKAVIDINGQAYRPPLADVSPYWRGDAVILWKPPYGKAYVGLGDRGESVRWIRQRLGIPSAPGVEPVFDQEVQARVAAFQGEKGLLTDGRAGPYTMLHLGPLGDTPGEPRLSEAQR